MSGRATGRAPRVSLSRPDDSKDPKAEKAQKNEVIPSFQADFDRVVKQDSLRFDGDFAHGKPLPHAPNPCLQIEGLGTVGLPLNDTEAQRVFEHSVKASPSRSRRSGTSVKTKIDKQSIHDIEGSRVSFRSPVWKPFFDELVKTACKALAAPFSRNVPTCELRKLSLCQAGTPSYLTEKTGFATLVVLLPSCYTGGRVQVSHDGSTRTFDFAAQSDTEVFMFALYNETSYTVDPIASGCQLALVYDVIPTSSAIPRLPVLQPALSELRKVLQKWSEGHYANDDSGLNLIAIVLTHKYDGGNLTSKILRGEDHHRASHIHAVAAELGYIVGLAKLRYRILGVMDKDCESVCECCTCIKMDNMVDLDGVQIPGFAKLKLSNANLILDKRFQKQRPDKTKDYSRIHCAGDYSDTDCDIGDSVNLTHDYWRFVLFLFHKNQELSLSLASGDVSSVLQRIQDNPSQEKTPENVLVVSHILKHAHAQQDKREISAVAGYALLWKDVDIWKQVIEKVSQSKISTYHSGPFEIVGKEGVFKACSTFPFNDIQTTLTAILDSGVAFRNQVDIVKLLQTRSSDKNITKWCSERMSMILTSLQKMKLSEDDAPALLSVIADRGLAVLTDVILPQLSPQSGGDLDFDLWTVLIQGLYDQKARIADESGQATQVSQKRSFEHAIDLFFTTMMQQWKSIKSPMFAYAKSSVILQIGRLLDLCITNRNLDACTTIFRVVVAREKEYPDAQFEDVYRPLVPKLRELLQKHSTLDFWSHPFKDFIRFLIEQCLHKLGLKPASTLTMRKIGCGCQMCGALDAFMLSNNTTKQFPGPRNQGQHLEQQISRASEIVTSSRSRPSGNKSFTLVVTKRTGDPALAQWKVRQKAAESFLASIGDSDVIAKIMGPRVVDVQKALTGVAVFAVDPSIAGMFRNQQSTTAPTTTVAAKNTTLPAMASNSTNSTNSRGAASKRKRDGES